MPSVGEDGRMWPDCTSFLDNKLYFKDANERFDRSRFVVSLLQALINGTYTVIDWILSISFVLELVVLWAMHLDVLCSTPNPFCFFRPILLQF